MFLKLLAKAKPPTRLPTSHHSRPRHKNTHFFATTRQILWSDRLDDTDFRHASHRIRRPHLTSSHLRNCDIRLSPLTMLVSKLPRSTMASRQSPNTQPTTAASPFTPHGNPDVTLSGLHSITPKEYSLSPTTIPVPPETSPLPPSALQPESHSQYPLLTTDCAPFPYVDPTLTIWPDSKAAQLSILRRLPGKLPVVTPKNLSVGIHMALKKKPGPRPPIYHAPMAHITAPPTQMFTVVGGIGGASIDGTATASTATSGNMGPPPHAPKKRKRDNQDSGSRSGDHGQRKISR
jgi:hypothetical protein